MVAGEGPMPCLGMVVGEAPGHKEMEVGRPFVGRSGRLLDVALKSLGVNRAEVYVTNIVKTIPLTSEGKIRRPFSIEIEAWRSILESEIENVAPRAILALGRTATDALTGSTGVPAGSTVDNVWTAWHPSYLLHQGQGEFGDTLYDRQEQWLDQLRPWAEAIR